MTRSTEDQLTESIEALALLVSTIGDCDCDTDEGLPCEQHGTVIAQFEGSSSRSADMLVSVVLDELMALPGMKVPTDAEDVATRFGAALSALDPFSSWVEDPDLAEAAADLCHEMDSALPEGYVSAWDDGWTLWRVTGGPLTDDGQTVETFTEDALEVYATARVDHRGTSIESVTIVTGTGGPHIEVTVTTSGRATAVGYWGSDHVERHVTASDALSAWIDNYAETLGVES